MVGVTAAFLAHALLFASWTAHIPHIKAELGLSDAALGTALLGAPLGSVTAGLLSRYLLPRFGSHRMMRLSMVGYAVSGVGVGLAPSTVWLFVVLAVWGLFQGALDVAMNTQGVTVENFLGRPIMARLHGMWSIGGLLGALIGAGAVGIGIPLSAQLLALGLLALGVVLLLSRGLLPDQQSTMKQDDAPAASRPGRRRSFTGAVLVLGGVSFASMLCEGASADWSANYLSSELGASAGLAGLGYAGYTLTMVMMRFSGSFLQTRIPSRRLLCGLAIVPVIGMTAALTSGDTVLGLVGFASLGIGLALLVPTAFSAAGSSAETGGNAGSAISTVAALGWIGFLLGPPLIGHLAAVVGLRSALIVLPVLALLIAVVVASTRAFAVNPASANLP